MNWSQWNNPKLLVSLLLIALFGFAFINNPDDETMKGAVILAFATAYGFWLGKNDGDDAKSQNTGAAFRAIEATANAKGTDTTSTDALHEGDAVTLERK